MPLQIINTSAKAINIKLRHSGLCAIPPSGTQTIDARDEDKAQILLEATAGAGLLHALSTEAESKAESDAGIVLARAIQHVEDMRAEESAARGRLLLAERQIGYVKKTFTEAKAAHARRSKAAITKVAATIYKLAADAVAALEDESRDAKACARMHTAPTDKQKAFLTATKTRIAKDLSQARDFLKSLENQT